MLTRDPASGLLRGDRRPAGDDRRERSRRRPPPPTPLRPAAARGDRGDRRRRGPDRRRDPHPLLRPGGLKSRHGSVTFAAVIPIKESGRFGCHRGEADTRAGVPGMIVAEICPDCGARLPADSPAGLCPRLSAPPGRRPLGRSGAGTSDVGGDRPRSTTYRAGDRGFRVAADRRSTRDGAIGAVARVHLRDDAGRHAADPARFAGDARPLGPAVALPARSASWPGAGWARSSRGATSTSAGTSPSR